MGHSCASFWSLKHLNIYWVILLKWKSLLVVWLFLTFQPGAKMVTASKATVPTISDQASAMQLSQCAKNLASALAELRTASQKVRAQIQELNETHCVSKTSPSRKKNVYITRYSLDTYFIFSYYWHCRLSLKALTLWINGKKKIKQTLYVKLSRITTIHIKLMSFNIFSYVLSWNSECGRYKSYIIYLIS